MNVPSQTVGRPESDEIPSHYVGYIKRVPELDPVIACAAQIEETATLLRTFDADAWQRRGTASGKPVSVRALAYMIPGHERHHVEVLRTRYGVGAVA